MYSEEKNRIKLIGFGFHLLLVLLLFLSTTRAQEKRGLYPIKNYTSKDYKELPQNWAVVQDNRGVMYIGNNAGILEYDGVSWRTIGIPNETNVRSLSIDKKNNRIYIGASGEIGFLGSDSAGVLKYISLLDKLKISEREFADVWRTHVMENGNVFFQASEKIFMWDGKIIHVYKPKKSFHLSFIVGDDLFVRDSEVGLLKWNKNNFELVPGTELLSTERVYFMLPLSKDKILLNTRSQGLMTLQLPSASFPLARLTPFQSSCNELIINSLVYNAVQVSPNIISIGTLNAGVIVIDTLGNLVHHFTKKEGLQQETVYYQYVDSENKLWLALANGISKIDILSPITYYNDSKGLEGSVKAIARYNNVLYVATNSGIFYLSNDNRERLFHKLQKLETECWDLTVAGTGNNQKLLIAANLGLYSLDKEGNLNRINNEVTFSLKVAASDSSLVYTGRESGFAVLKDFNGVMVELREGVNDIINIQEEDASHIWLGTNGNGVIELEKEDGIYRPTRYNGANGFVDGSVWVAKYRGDIVMGTDKGLYKVIRDKRKTTFELFKAGDFFTGNLIGVHRAFVFNDRLWLAIYSNVKKESESIGYLIGDESAGYKWEESAFLKMPRDITHAIFYDKDNVAWIGRPDGLYRYESQLVNSNQLDYQTMIRKIFIGKDSLLYGGAGLASGNDEGMFDFKYNFNSVSFSFASNSYEDETKNMYSYMLVGNDETWSNWAYETKTNYTNLREGTYYFKVKARNVYGKQSKEAVFAFTILPPWYRTWWAYLSYFVLLITVIWGVVAWSTSSLRKIIAERTAEIREQKEELDFKNKEITDSINYARRLQRAILPYMEDIKQKLPDTFVYYKPRDIVSGDLYWYADKGGKVFLASIDCTGHGVPGAFLSVVANSSLNEIVNEQEDDLMPHHVLQKLDEKITWTLKQGSQYSSTRDGMDLALCMIDTETRTLYYSGANRPLFFIRDNKLEKVKGDKFPIGGGYDVNKQFSLNTKQLQKGDVFYIFSDGYADQFGGPQGKKFMIKRFGDMLLEMCNLGIEEQERRLDAVLKQWQGGHESVDDVLVIGVKV